MRAKRTKKKEDWAAYKKSKKESQRECRRVYSSHINNLVSDDQTGNPKKLTPSSSPRSVTQVVLLPSRRME